MAGEVSSQGRPPGAPNPVPPAGPTLACTQFKPRLKPAPNPNMLSVEVKQFTFLPNSDDKSACLSFFLGFSIYVVIDYFAPNSSDFNLDGFDPNFITM